MQKCKERTCGNDGIISSYKPLVRSESGEHKKHLCEKCKRGYECFESGTYFGYQYIWCQIIIIVQYKLVRKEFMIFFIKYFLLIVFLVNLARVVLLSSFTNIITPLLFDWLLKICCCVLLMKFFFSIIILLNKIFAFFFISLFLNIIRFMIVLLYGRKSKFRTYNDFFTL
jgi:hypothetical protein